VLGKLNEAANNFHNATANFTVYQKTVSPIGIDEEKQEGNSVFARENGSVEVAAHIRTTNGKPARRDLVYSRGILQVYTASTNQLDTYNSADKKATYESFLTLGFGGSGTELEKNWTVSYAGKEKVDGIEVEKLDLVSRLPSVRDIYSKVTLWLDLNLGVSRKQLFIQKDGSSRTAFYTSVVVNGKKLPADAFQIKRKAAK
jgi:hypothetical protein